MSAKRPDRRGDPGNQTTDLLALGVGTGVVVTAGGVMWLSVTLAHRIAGTPLESSPAARVLGVFTGATEWTPAATWIMSACVLVLIALGTLAMVSWSRRARRKTRVDPVAAHMAAISELTSLSRKGALETAGRLGITGSPGVMIARHLLSGEALYGSFEDMHVDIWGPRMGKSTSRAIPAIVAAPGAVITTSNKRDVLDATRALRAERGQVWVFDPQRVADEPPSWYWDPLSYVVDEEAAARLAEHFAFASRAPGAKADAFFDNMGQTLLANLLLAASLAQYPITQVLRWLNRPSEEEALDILREHDYLMQADQLAAVFASPEKQRGGVFGTAQQMAACLASKSVQAWVCRDGEDDLRPTFDPHEFVRSSATLYSLSREGIGTAGPLVTALIVAVTEAAEKYATQSRGGRLPVPLIGVLDEAANVCRWKQLPDLYSHFGSRGIILMTILQTWAQGVEVWGDRGMQKLWSASNIKVYGGNVDEKEFLEARSAVIGDYDRVRTSTSRDASVFGGGRRNVSTRVEKERIMPVADLAALPRGRAVVFSAGNRPALVQTVPWMRTEYADKIRASILAHDPKGVETIAAAEDELAAAEEELEMLEAA